MHRPDTQRDTKHDDFDPSTSSQRTEKKKPSVNLIKAHMLLVCLHA